MEAEVACVEATGGCVVAVVSKTLNGGHVEAEDEHLEARQKVNVTTARLTLKTR